MSTAEMEREEFRALVLRRKAEVLAILYVDSAAKWAECHIKTATAEADVTRLRAELSYLETLIADEQKRLKEPTANAESGAAR